MLPSLLMKTMAINVSIRDDISELRLILHTGGDYLLIASPRLAQELLKELAAHLGYNLTSETIRQRSDAGRRIKTR